MDVLVGQQIFFCLCAPQAVVALGDLRQLCEQRVGLAELLKIGDGRQWKLDLRVDQLLAAADVRQVQRRIDNGVQAADVGDHCGGVDLAGGHHVDGLAHIAGIAAGGAYHMGVEIMDVVPVELGLEFLVGRACEEVEAAVVAEDVARLLNNRTHRREADHVVIARAAGQLT